MIQWTKILKGAQDTIKNSEYNFPCTQYMEPEFWYQQHTLDSDTHHLNNHMIEMIQKYMRGDATGMERYIDLGAVIYEFKGCFIIFYTV